MNYLVQFFSDAHEVVKGFGTLTDVTQEGGGVIDSCHPEAALVDPLSVLAGDAVIGFDEPHGGDASQTDDDFRANHTHLTAEVADAGILLRLLRVTVAGWAAFHDVGDVILRAVEVDDFQHLVEELSRRTHKGASRQVLLLAGAFSHEHNGRIGVALSEYHVMSRPAQLAFFTRHARLSQLFPVTHFPRPFVFFLYDRGF